MSFCPWNWKHIIPRTLYILPPSEVKETSTKSFRMSKETTLIVACGARTSTHELMWPPTRGKRSFDYHGITAFCTFHFSVVTGTRSETAWFHFHGGREHETTIFLN